MTTMQPDLPQNNLPPSVERPQPSARMSLRRFGRALYRRPFVKASALLIAILFWGIVIASDPTLLIDKTIGETTVTVIGTETLRNRGFVVMKDLTSEPITVRMRVQVKQSDYDRAIGERFSPRLDLSQITGAGTQQVKFSAYADLGTVLSIEPESIELTVDAYMQPTRIPIAVELVGEASESIWFAEPTFDPKQVYVSGPKSIVERIHRAVIEVPITNLTAGRASDNLALPVTLQDADGQEISSPLLKITNESVNVDFATVHVDVYPMREIPISVDTAIVGTPAHGYEVGEVRVSPSTVWVAAKQDVLDQIDTVHVSTPLDVSGQSVSQVVTSSLRGLSGVAHVSTNETVLEVDLVPAIHTHTYVDLPITVMGLSPGLAARLSQNEMTAVISGEYQNVESLAAGDLHLYVDASSLSEGVHTVDVQCRADGTDAYTCELERPQLTLTLTATGTS